MEGIAKYEGIKSEAREGILEANPEYKLIVDSNNLTVDIDNEINIIHKYCRYQLLFVNNIQ